MTGPFRAEVIHRRGPWRSFEAVAFAALEAMDGFNASTARTGRPRASRRSGSVL
jgi:hypothetical protein